MKKLLILLFSILISFNSYGESEISLYNSNGEAVAYIAVNDDFTIYLWDGEPVAYLDDDDVYGFNGKHLGWFSQGIIIDHDGNSPCVIKNSYPGFTQFEGFKGFKSFKPFKGFKNFAPFKPFTSYRFSSIPCSFYLAMRR